MADHINGVVEKVIAKNPGEPEFHQAVREVAASLHPVLAQSPRYVEDKILERLVEPDRVISFGVNWVGDDGEIHVNRGYRVQMSNSIGPYKGGLRFHPECQRRRPEVPRIRADPQELAHQPSTGWRKRRL